MTRARDVVVVGGGIAGISVAWQAALRGARVTLLEQEGLLGTHSSARNAAIWLPTEHGGTSPTLTRRSAHMLDGLLGRDGWLARTGALVTAADPALLGVSEAGARASGAQAHRVELGEAVRLAPSLRGGSTVAALHVPDAGVLDIHAMMEAVARAARSAGVQVRASARAREVTVVDGRARGVVLEDGETIGADTVVLAAGAWSSELGRAAGAPIDAAPLRRHLVVLEVAGAEQEPVVWNVGDEVYYRPESGGVLASPCDEVRFDACLPPTDPAQLEVLAARLTALAPRLAGAGIRRAWACLRTYTADRELVAGPDPRLPGLAWLAGLGGRGMTIGPAAGELVARLIDGETDVHAAVVSPVR